MKGSSRIAFLWDESFLWALMAFKKLSILRLSFELIRSEDIKKGILKNYELLFVPGGWASNKLKALGSEGIEEIKRFVYNGGNYFGICGGAGLATSEGIGLLNIKRKLSRERVPSFSGRIRVNLKEHTLWKNIEEREPVFYAWWPSQFVLNDSSIEILATFSDAMPDAFSSDLCTGDVMINWDELERLYGINLDPARLKNEPAVVEGRFGKGKVLLSLLHFDTPEDKTGSEVLKNIWQYLSSFNEGINQVVIPSRRSEGTGLSRGYFSQALLDCFSGIIDFGIRNFLWFWRTPMLLQWRRGVRGLEYCTLYIMAKELAEIDSPEDSELNFEERGLLEECYSFKEKALYLLMLERQAMQRGMINYEHADDSRIQALRKELFGDNKSHGGKFKELLDRIDGLLYNRLTAHRGN